MPKFGIFELPEIDEVETACDVCHALKRVGQETVGKRREEIEERYRDKPHELKGALTIDANCYDRDHGNSCLDKDKARILLEYFALLAANTSKTDGDAKAAQ
ncbi:MAG: hypothetical protein UT33_C0007G0064 [Candidatus Peregrinibacteria bacterium GW2011_GWC2_39_14]|nr:MAG: hypothetical protein US92_C0002G0065 [Candidatus Peregrinibacteria bacterium GW2011_GWA2_38_36]KKR06876.1 MAG: hypothetical protein UT33_C0007G0064 [Candidatus Peregrinibacteria bacterium GW2011_GWC2_39_14]